MKILRDGEIQKVKATALGCLIGSFRTIIQLSSIDDAWGNEGKIRRHRRERSRGGSFVYVRLYLPREGSSAVKGLKFLILSVVFMAAGICSFLLFVSSFLLPHGNTHTTLQPRSTEKERQADRQTDRETVKKRMEEKTNANKKERKKERRRWNARTRGAREKEGASKREKDLSQPSLMYDSAVRVKKIP